MFDRDNIIFGILALDLAWRRSGGCRRRVRFTKLNVDENPATAARFKVGSIPTLLVLKAGQEVDRIVGVQPKAEIPRRLERVRT